MTTIARTLAPLAFAVFLIGVDARGQDPTGQGQTEPPVKQPPRLGGDEVGAGVESVESAVAGEDGSVVYAGPAKMLAHGRVSFTGFTDPKRLSPGQSGTLFVQVEIREETVIPPSPLRLEHLREQGPLVLGDEHFDAPKTRDSRAMAYVAGYYDTFLVRIPVTVRADAVHGKYPVRTKAIFSVAEATGGRQSEQLSQDVQVDVVVGPPVPQPPAPVGRRAPTQNAADTTPVSVSAPVEAAADPRPTPGGAPSGSGVALPVADPGSRDLLQTDGTLSLQDDDANGAGAWWFWLAVLVGGGAVLVGIRWLMVRGRA
jgi:hypothetical protein